VENQTNTKKQVQKSAEKSNFFNHNTELVEVTKFVKQLHEDLRNFGNLENERKATIVSVILLALELDKFDPKELTGDKEQTDGEKIFNAMRYNLEKVRQIQENTKLNEIYEQFSFIKNDIVLNQINNNLEMSPIKYFTLKLRDEIILRIKTSPIDILGNFYGEFVKYGGSDGNSLGIVLTPSHLTNLMVKLLEVTPDDTILDPCCGSGAFLISALNYMKTQTKNKNKIKQITQNQLFGVELQQKLFAICSTNMILRTNCKPNIERGNIFDIDDKTYNEKVTKLLMNPPFSQAKSKDLWYLSELNFIKKALNLVKTGGRLAALVPQSAMIGKDQKQRQIKVEILKEHTLDVVITLSSDAFYGVGVAPCIAIFKVGIPQGNQKARFINFQDDGYFVRKNVGLIENDESQKKREYLLKVFNSTSGTDNEKFILKTEVNGDDEWLHSFYYSDNELPTDEDFEETIADYLTFKYNIYLHNKGYIFGDEEVVEDGSVLEEYTEY
jgi:type I restriction-modification system DNA methylase subunit